MRFVLPLILLTFPLFSLPPVPDDSALQDPYWAAFFAQADETIEENFWGNLNIVRKSKLYDDPYVRQLEKMGYGFDLENPHFTPFLNSVRWICQELVRLVEEGQVTDDEILWPAKAFSLGDSYVFVPLGQPVPFGAEALNLLTPDVFVRMLAEGYFPIGEPIREHTNQTLSEHDLAHMAGFVSNARYMKAVREAFRRVGQKQRENPRVAQALEHFDSLYSLRLYYMVEVFTEVPEEGREELQKLIELPLGRLYTKEEVVAFLEQKAQEPTELYRYLSQLYARFHALVNPLGGESRDMLNRRRKFRRGNTLGSFYDAISTLSSKFYGNSLYSIFLNANAALENKRSNHPDFLASIEEIHAPVLGALLGTSWLSVEDWVLECTEEIPNPNSKLYHYLHDSGFWDQRHVIHWAYCHPEYDLVLTQETMNRYNPGSNARE